ncbi:molybdopterin molybdotransferase MoeA [Thiomicrospira microaerophila]|uniref:molybdopterin molybdotransferase MoeA n=1 Tax=Thiomicrospira microaerophila TaxID=406020 RepID=UPI00201039CD|nr:gephyrin-like molybdotransferase Glp [Thiomicrospira microaerophila]UQB42357.1 molybdopterin molybdotransferase MoeA [Thiomicrospira microaerophila]
MKTVNQAIEYLIAQASKTQLTESRSLANALGCVLAKPVVSAVNVPPHDNSMMDGYAVNTAEIQIGRSMAVSQRIPAGTQPEPLAAASVARIFTGAPIPSGADAVIMQEQAEITEQGVCFQQMPKSGESIRRCGEDIAVGAEILSSGHQLRPQDLALIASVGQAAVEVYKPLTLVTLTTGDELLQPGQAPQPGKIYNSNHTNLMTLVTQLGFNWVDMGQVEDTLKATQAALSKAAQLGDVIITTGGVSVGEEDHLKPAVEALGKLDMWQVKMKPGKPLAFGEVMGKPFIGLPGNPVSAFTTFNLFARPFLLAMQGVTDLMPPSVWLTADFDWPNPGFRREFVRARIENRDQTSYAQIYPNQGSGVLTSTVWAAGLVVIPEDQVIKKGDRVEYISFNDLAH